MKLLIVFFVCIFNIYGLVFFMSDAEKVIDILIRTNWKAKVYSTAAIAGISLCVMYSGSYLIFWLLLEYIVVLCWYGKKKIDHLKSVQRGACCILAMILMELFIIFLYYYKGIENLESTGKINYEIQIACYFGMAFVQYLFIIFREIKKTTAGYRRILMLTLAVKSVGDIIWLFMCIGTAAFKENYIILSIMFIAELTIDYYAFCIMILKIAERTEQNKRADIHVNAYEYYLNMEEEHLQIRKMYHEMKNQLMIMDAGEQKMSERSAEKKQAVLEKLESMNQFYHTGVKSLDMLLFDGKMKAQARNIEFEAVVSEGCLDFMDEEDVNVIFSNAIINAIEACEKIENGPRKIKIKAGKNLNDTLIYVKNTVCQKREKGSLSTKKKNRIMHGIGLTSIQECVEKYGGYVSIIEEASTFQLAILFGKE